MRTAGFKVWGITKLNIVEDCIDQKHESNWDTIVQNKTTSNLKLNFSGFTAITTSPEKKILLH